MKKGVAEFFTSETTTNEHGGRQSATPFRLDLLDPYAVLRLGQVLKSGADRHGVDNWRRITSREHVNHALGHLLGHLAGDTSDPHLENALCRLLFAVAVDGLTPEAKEAGC